MLGLRIKLPPLKNRWSAVAEMLSQRRHEQRVRLFLHNLFKDKVPNLLYSQPAIIVVDQAEELLRAYRAEFLVGFYNLVKEGCDKDLLGRNMFIKLQRSRSSCYRLKRKTLQRYSTMVIPVLVLLLTIQMTKRGPRILRRRSMLHRRRRSMVVTIAFRLR
jgi:hypothetical protein